MRKELKDVIVNIEDFSSSGWENVVDLNKKSPHEVAIADIFFVEAEKYYSDNFLAKAKVFYLLSMASSMILRPESINEPFKPRIIWEGKRSPIPDDFDQVEVDFFSQICEYIDDNWLKGRLADLVWLLKSPREHRFALLAIDAYCSIPLDVKNWFREGAQCLERAIVLSKQLRSNAHLVKIENCIISTIQSLPNSEQWLMALASILYKYKLGGSVQDVIAHKIYSFADLLFQKREYLGASDVYATSEKWFKRAGNIDKKIQSIARSAEMLQIHADTIKNHQGDYGVAAHFYEKAIQKYRLTPLSKRADYQVDSRIDKLFISMKEASQASISQMVSVNSPSIDISLTCAQVRALITGNNLLSDLTTLANVYDGINLTELREKSKELIENTPLLSLFSSEQVSNDGRITAKNDDALYTEMMRSYKIRIEFIVCSLITPALETVQLHYRLSESSFLHFLQISPITPEGRAVLFAKGLFAGYDSDFVSSTHLLVPQLEHMVRYHLKRNNVKTTTLDKAGVETENGLSTLIELPEATRLFGDNLAFEIKALFCDSFGFNLRNELAHGLLDSDDFDSKYIIYMWWLAFRLIFNSYLKAAQSHAAK